MNNNAFWIHSLYVNNGIDDAVIVKEKVLQKDGSLKPKLKIYSNIKRRFWVTNPKYRDHNLKKEYESMDHLDEYLVYQKDLEKELFYTLNGFYSDRKPSLKALCNSPYVYGADISPEVLVKLKYEAIKKQFHPNMVVPVTEGFLDIETNMITEEDHDEIILMSVTHENKVYTAIHENYFYKDRKFGEKKEKATLEDLRYVVKKRLGNDIEKHNLQLHYQLCRTEVDIIKWIFQNIHENKTDFIGVWNINFDMPKIIDALVRYNIDPADVFCHPEVPKDFRKFHYKEDKDKKNKTGKSNAKPKPHHEKWHWLFCSGHTQFLDSMCLYSRLRKVKGMYDSYALDDTLFREIKRRKLAISEDDTHYYNQKYMFLSYTAYNIFDVVGLYLMEKNNTDIYTMGILVGTSVFSQFAYGTVMLTNELYEYAIEKDLVLGTVGKNMKDEFDDLIAAQGGTVLRTENSKGVGLNCIKEMPFFETLLSVMVSDLDFSAFYPRTQIGANIAKETKRLTAIMIAGISSKINYFFSLALSPRENCVTIMEEFFNLKGYDDADEIATMMMADTIKSKPYNGGDSLERDYKDIGDRSREETGLESKSIRSDNREDNHIKSRDRLCG